MKKLKKVIALGLSICMLGMTPAVNVRADDSILTKPVKNKAFYNVDGNDEIVLSDAQTILKYALKIIPSDITYTLADAQMCLKIALKIVELDEETAPTEVPIVQAVGTVDDAVYQKAVSAFEPVVKKMRADGLVKNSDVCVTMDSVSINADITFDNDELDLTLVKDNSTNSYTLTFDYDFTWLEGFGPTVNGKDPAAYNKELLIAMLSMVSDEPKVVFDRIDLDCFSAAGLYVDEWTEIADCFIMNGGMEVDKYISYMLTKEDVDRRDASYVLTGTRSDGSKIECVIEYDSSVVTFETLDVLSGDGVSYVHTLDDTKIGPHCSFAVKNDCASYEEYKQDLLEQFIAKGDSDASITEYTSHRVNGYTYYWIEGFYKTETDIGDPDFVYVQIGENEYIELYNVMFEERFEDFINTSFYIREVK